MDGHEGRGLRPEGRSPAQSWHTVDASSFPSTRPRVQQSPRGVWGTWEYLVAAGDMRVESLGPNKNEPRMPHHTLEPQLPSL